MTRISGTLEDQISGATQDNTDVVTKAMEGMAPGQVSSALADRVGDLTKGRKGGYDEGHAVFAAEAFRSAIKKGRSNPAEVAKGLSPQFSNSLSAAIANSNTNMATMTQWAQQLEAFAAELGKNISLTSPLSSGLVPFDLAAPAKLIYPVYSPLRNMIPRTQGHGTAHRAKVITAVSGSNPGSLAVPGNRISIPELPAGGGLGGNQWPNNLPGSGSQTAIDLNVPYKFFGLSESISWLAQFAGQGFEDAEGLANLVLMQEMMMLEERAIISATGTSLSAPATPGLANITSLNSGEVGLSGVTTNVYVVTTAVNFYGETAPSAIASVASANGNVINITPSPSVGALAQNIYVATGTTAPALSAFHLAAAGVGASVYTLQGAIPTTGATPPTADTGTGASTDYEGLVSTISGHAAGGVYPAGYQGSYVNQSVNDTLSVNAINNAFNAMWNGSAGIFADPDILLAEGTDLNRLGLSMANAGTGTAGYRLEINQGEVQNMRAGASTREVVNGITQKIVKMQVHPYLPQGTAMPLSFKLPQPQQNISNVWENVMVQDYLAISWPVIDVTYRKSLFMYGALFCPAVQFNGLLQGIQKTVRGTTGTNS